MSYDIQKILILVTFMLIFAGCDILSTREPEAPESSTFSATSATNPELLFQNFKDSFKDKVVENYMSCFIDSLFLSDSYVFVPSAGAASNYPALLEWNLASEQQHFKQLLVVSNNDLPIVLNLLNEEKLQTGDSAIVRFDYNLQLNVVNETLNGEYQGIAEFQIKLDSRNIWVITKWTDIKKEDFVSWSDLKGQYY